MAILENNLTLKTKAHTLPKHYRDTGTPHCPIAPPPAPMQYTRTMLVVQ